MFSLRNKTYPPTECNNKDSSKSILSKETITYLDNLLRICNEIVKENLISILLFGSMVKGGFIKGVSDFDTIVVVDDRVTKNQIINIGQRISSMMDATSASISEPKYFEGIPKIIMKESGMFVSPFVCRESEFISGDFSKIFHTNPILGKLLVPSPIVIGSVLKSSMTAFGKNLIPIVKTKDPSPLDILKSLKMNELLILLSLFYLPFTKNATKLAMEATKWSVYNASYILTKDAMSLENSIELLNEAQIASSHLEQLKKLRTDYRNNILFALSSLIAILRIHYFLFERRRDTILVH